MLPVSRTVFPLVGCKLLIRGCFNTGLYKFLEKCKAAKTLSGLAGADSLVRCAFNCCYMPYNYLDEYFAVLGPELFLRTQIDVGKGV